MVNLTPDKDNINIQKAIKAMGLLHKPVYVPIETDDHAVTGMCFLNVADKVKSEGGGVVYGWQFCEYQYMIEAEFHAVWRKITGEMIDITPFPVEGISKQLFVEDPGRIFDGRRTCNFYYNTSGNGLIDDLIEIEKAKFRIDENAELLEGTNCMIHSEIELSKIDFLIKLSQILESMYNSGDTIDSGCICESGQPFKTCCRASIQNFIKAV